MYMKKEYTFYFDETYHTRKITEKNKIFDLKDNVEFYVGCYIGSCEWDKIKNDIIKLENDYKEKQHIPTEAELKTKTLIKANQLPFGVCSLKDNTIDFYTKLLQILNGKVKIHLSILNKQEYLIKTLLPNYSWFNNYRVNYKAFIYSFTKFVITHPHYRIIDILVSKEKDRQKRRKIIRILQKHLDKISDIDKKHDEIMAVHEMVNIFYNIPMHFNNNFPLPWDYSISSAMFFNFTKELKLPVKKIYIDEEKNTVEATKKYFSNVEAIKSNENIQIRMCDWIVGLISRLILSYSQNYRTIPIEVDLSETIHILPNDFFNFTPETDKLMRLLYKVFILQQEGYWSTAGSIYNDGATEFYTFLRYKDFCEENNTPPTSDEFNIYLGKEQQYVFSQFI